MQDDVPCLARLGPEHLDGAVALSHAEGWPHRVEDWALVVTHSRGWVALDGGRVVATAIATPFGSVATLNMILVERGWRGRGIGRWIVEHAMAQLSPGQWRLVATQEGLPLYKRLGFEPCGEVIQHQGIARAALGGVPEAWAKLEDAPRLAALDRAATGMARAWLVEALLREGRILSHREGGEVVAFAALRRFGQGDVAGPIVARSEEEARALLATLLISCAGRFLRVDIPDGTGLAAGLRDHGLVPVGTGLAMRRGTASPAVTTHRPFALASQAFG